MHKSILIEGKKIVYRVTGSGQPVVLLHGFGEEANVWDKAEKSLEKDYRLIIPDLPGSGESEMIPDMSMEGMAEAIIEILETEYNLPALNEKENAQISGSKVPLAGGFRGAVVIGHSMGGYITLALAERYPEWLSAFGLFHSSAFADSDEKKATRQKGIAFIREHGAYPFLETATPNLFSPLTREKNPGLVAQQLAGLHNFSALALVSYYEAMMKRPDRTDVLRKTTVPVLFILGLHDTAVPVEDGLKLCHLPEKSYIHILRNSGHMGMLEEPGKTNLILRQFLAEY